MKKKLQFYVWLLQGHLRKHAYRVLLITLIIIIMLGFLAWWLPTLSKPDDSIYIEGIVGKYTRTQLPQTVLEYISKGLVTTDAMGNPVPEIAESVETSDDGKTFTVRLKKGIKWHNNTELTSHDLAYNLNDVIVEKPDNYTLVFKLKDSFAPFPTLLTAPLIKYTSDKDILGVGEYYIKKLEYSQYQFITSLELESMTKKPKTIKIKIFPTEEAAITALKLGQIFGVQMTNADKFQNWNNVIIYKKVMPRRFIGVYFKYDDPVVGGKEPSLRQALSMAVTDIPGQIPFSGPFPKNSWAETELENKYRYNIEKAREVIKNIKSKQKNESGKIEITLSALEQYKSVADHIANDWRNVGIEVTVQLVKNVPEKFQALILAQELPIDPDQYSLWHSTQKKSNITGYTNPRADKDLEDARKTVNREVRKQKYADFKKQIFTDVPIIYLYQPTSEYVMLKKYNFESVQKLKKFKQ